MRYYAVPNGDPVTFYYYQLIDIQKSTSLELTPKSYSFEYKLHVVAKLVLK